MCKITYFRSINSHNDEAMEEMANLNGSQDRAYEIINGVRNNVAQMVNSLTHLLPDKVDFYNGHPKDDYMVDLADRFREIFDKGDLGKGLKIVAEADEEWFSPAVLTALSRRAHEGLTALNPCLEGDFDPAEIDLRQIVTPHDMIRYVHRMATYSLFDPNVDSWRYGVEEWGASFSDGGISMNVISTDGTTSAEGALESNPFLKRTKEIATSGKFVSKRCGLDCLYVITDGDEVSMQLPLGCHYATLRVSPAEESQTKITLRYTDTIGYSSSNFRQQLAEDILRSLDLNVTRNKNIVTTNDKFSDQDMALDIYEMILRFALSMKDVDVLGSSSGLEDRLLDSVRAFRSGVLNLSSYIANHKQGTYVKFARDAGSLLNFNPESSEEEREEESGLEREVGEAKEASKGLPYVPMEGELESLGVKALKSFYRIPKRIWKNSRPNYAENLRTGLVVGGVIVGFVAGGLIGIITGSDPGEIITKENHPRASYIYLDPSLEEASKENETITIDDNKTEGEHIEGTWDSVVN